MRKETKEALESFASSSYWETMRDELLKPLAVEYGDVSRPFKYGKKELRGVDAYYAKVGATIALKELIKSINRIKKSEVKITEDFE